MAEKFGCLLIKNDGCNQIFDIQNCFVFNFILYKTLSVEFIFQWLPNQHDINHFLSKKGGRKLLQAAMDLAAFCLKYKVSCNVFYVAVGFASAGPWPKYSLACRQFCASLGHSFYNKRIKGSVNCCRNYFSQIKTIIYLE